MVILVATFSWHLRELLGAHRKCGMWGQLGEEVQISEICDETSKAYAIKAADEPILVEPINY